jgi:hypothetical protein
LEDLSLRPAPANSVRDPVSKIITPKWTGGVAQEGEHLLCKNEVLSSNPYPAKKKKAFFFLVLLGD